MPKSSLLFKGNMSCALEDDLPLQDHKTEVVTNYEVPEKKVYS